MGVGPGGDPLQPPWPDLLVTCGRHAVGPSLAIGRLSGGRSFRVHIQHPHVDPRRFDLVVAPRSEEHTSELQSLMRNSYAVFCLKKKTNKKHIVKNHKHTTR